MARNDTFYCAWRKFSTIWTYLTQMCNRLYYSPNVLALLTVVIFLFMLASIFTGVDTSLQTVCDTGIQFPYKASATREYSSLTKRLRHGNTVPLQTVCDTGIQFPYKASATREYSSLTNRLRHGNTVPLQTVCDTGIQFPYKASATREYSSSASYKH